LDVVVPRDALWMMGDHRADSGDSRPHLGDGTASVPRANVVGRAFVTVWPVDQAHRLERPGTFDAFPEPDVPAPSGAVVHTPAFVRAGDR
jgi:signal peptidase I